MPHLYIPPLGQQPGDIVGWITPRIGTGSAIGTMGSKLRTL
jgi:hypothetical protein